MLHQSLQSSQTLEQFFERLYHHTLLLVGHCIPNRTNANAVVCLILTVSSSPRRAEYLQYKCHRAHTQCCLIELESILSFFVVKYLALTGAMLVRTASPNEVTRNFLQPYYDSYLCDSL